MRINSVFRLTMVLDADKFQYVFNRANLTEVDGDEYIDRSLVHKGITILYRDSQYKKKVDLTVNATVLLKGETTDSRKLIHKIEKRIAEYFGGKYHIDDFLLTELTLTADLNTGNRDMVDSYIRVLQRIGKVKGFSPSKYECFDEGHSFCLDGNSNGINFLIYDLRAVLKARLDGELGHKDKKQILGDTAGVLRTEVRLTTLAAIRNYAGKETTSNQIIALSNKKLEIFVGVLAKIVPWGDFCKKKDAVQIVRQKVKDLRLQRRMLWLIDLIPEKKSVLLAQKAMKYREPDKIMDAFAEIGLSPVTLSKRDTTKHLKSLYSYMD